MKMTVSYYAERLYPYLIGIFILVWSLGSKINILENPNLVETLNGVITVDSIIIGFLGAVMPVILSMKNESKFVRYVFENDNNNLFAKYLKETIFLGLFSAAFSLVLHLRESLDETSQLAIYYIWVWSTLSFLLLTYRSMNHMINIVFSKDNDCKVTVAQVEPDREKELEEKFKA